MGRVGARADRAHPGVWAMAGQVLRGLWGATKTLLPAKKPKLPGHRSNKGF